MIFTALAQPLAAPSLVHTSLLSYKHTPLNLVIKQRQQNPSRLACHRSSTGRSATPARAAADGAYPLDQAVAPEAPKPCATGRKIVFAADGKASAQEGLRWLASQLARKGACTHGRPSIPLRGAVAYSLTLVSSTREPI